MSNVCECVFCDMNIVTDVFCSSEHLSERSSGQKTRRSPLQSLYEGEQVSGVGTRSLLSETWMLFCFCLLLYFGAALKAPLIFVSCSQIALLQTFCALRCDFADQRHFIWFRKKNHFLLLHLLLKHFTTTYSKSQNIISYFLNIYFSFIDLVNTSQFIIVQNVLRNSFLSA